MCGDADRAIYWHHQVPAAGVQQQTQNCSKCVCSRCHLIGWNHHLLIWARYHYHTGILKSVVSLWMDSGLHSGSIKLQLFNIKCNTNSQLRDLKSVISIQKQALFRYQKELIVKNAEILELRENITIITTTGRKGKCNKKVCSVWRCRHCHLLASSTTCSWGPAANTKLQQMCLFHMSSYWLKSPLANLGAISLPYRYIEECGITMNGLRFTLRINRVTTI